jgi:hypothetical protein
VTEEQRRREGAEAELDRRIADLPKAVEPARDLWPDIEARLDEPDARGTPGYVWWGAVAAAVCAAALLPVLLQQAPPGDVPVPTATVPAAVPESTVPGLDIAGQQLRLRNAAVTSVEPGPEYRAARAELLQLLEERLAGLAPEDREIVVRNIETIRSALEEIDGALQDNPDDPLLQELMLQTYQKELDVMARVNGLAGPARRRTDL